VARLSVPAGLAVNTVTGGNVADWEIKDGTLAVTFLDAVEQKASILISFDARLPREGPIDLPLLQLLDCERETGGVAVEVTGEGEIKNLRSQGLERTEAAELGATAAARQSPSLVAFRYRTGGGVRSLNVDVARYVAQAVMTANIEDARYRALLTADGKVLVEARYAVRNNQRNFVKIALPAGAKLWSASLAGAPVRPGRAADGGLLFPLSKARAGEDAPVCPVEVLYLSTGPAWTEKGRAALVLPGLDLPVSRTALVVYHPPQNRVTVETGAFRVQAGSGMDRGFPVGSSSGSGAAAGTGEKTANSAATQALVDRYRARQQARKPVDTAPLRVEFPAVGPSLRLVSELTAENQAPAVELSYQREKR